MKKALTIFFVVFLLAAYRPGAGIVHGNEPSTDQNGRKQVHTHDHRPKNKYDLRHIDGKRAADHHKHGHKHVHKHNHKNAHDHEHGEEHDHGHAHQDHGLGAGHNDRHDHKVHDGHDHHGPGHNVDHGDHHHSHGIYDRVWDVATSG